MKGLRRIQWFSVFLFDSLSGEKAEGGYIGC